MKTMSIFSSPALIAFMALALAGCGTAGGGKSTGLASLGAFSSSSSTQPNLLEPLGNGLLGDVASQLSAGDRRKALEAEYRTLEYSPAGKAVSWSGSAASGDVMAAQPYQVGSQNCRQYTHTFVVSDVPQTARGTACRNTDGSWTPLN
ncbi:hypothetical protein DKP76_00075 [Falsochrobactrum shanghaiense]|uniref:Surface antigen domain-containing protein n=1 Tax=Falsochrobactrum shanghaiense TaxID=2201899 RepID=A0A316JEE0_9HYPH|nr:hypothetical protein [Falsochrobactrum shanghaiense]PWL19019.1 hypothetical protein DKP76_00075 [Falsochrobactrum shanghaiense]